MPAVGALSHLNPANTTLASGRCRIAHRSRPCERPLLTVRIAQQLLLRERIFAGQMACCPSSVAPRPNSLADQQVIDRCVVGTAGHVVVRLAARPARGFSSLRGGVPRALVPLATVAADDVVGSSRVLYSDRRLRSLLLVVQIQLVLHEDRLRLVGRVSRAAILLLVATCLAN